ncbi:MAG: ABC transporter ATP-binding protein [Planctomycetota bacterium]
MSSRPRTADPGGRPILAARDVRKAFAMGERTLEILHGVDLDLFPGELVALVGASGAGKSTLLHILGLLDRPSAGTVLLDGADVWNHSTVRRAALRNREIGFVFQFYHLLPELSALENVLLPAMIGESRLVFRSRRRVHRTRARELLGRFGMGDRLHHRPSQLSGGERQRVAMARALFNDPAILLADEPTGNLDRATGEKVLDLLFEEQRHRRLSMILVTHDERIARRCGRSIVMEDGQVQAAAR